MGAKYLIGGLVCLTLNVILLAVLTGITVTYIRSKQSNQPFKIGKNVTFAVQKELRLREEFDQASDINQVQNDLASIYQRDGNLMKPALHLLITGAINTADDVPVLSLQRHPNTSYQGVYHHDGTVSVPHGGYYYIYGGIRYKGEGTAELNYGRILHSILMQKESGMEESPTILMQNLQSTPTIRRGREAYITSSLGATFYLPPNSKVMVTSSIPENIDLSPGSYFGLFLV